MQDLKVIRSDLGNLITSVKGIENATSAVATFTYLSNRDKKIAQCSKASILSSMMAAVSLDLRVTNTALTDAYLVPYKSKYGYMLQFQLGYQGCLTLASRAGFMIEADVVIRGDDFKHHRKDSIQYVDHTYGDGDRTDMDSCLAAYAVAHHKDMPAPLTRVMMIEEIRKVESTAEAESTRSPWKSWPEEMIKKTVIKKLCKYIPSNMAEDLKTASEYDSLAQVNNLTIDDKGTLVRGMSGRVITKASADMKADTKNIVLNNLSKDIEEDNNED